MNKINNLERKCRYCGAALAAWSPRPNKSGACSKCRYRAHRDKDPLSYKERAQRWWAANKERGRALHKAWHQNNPDKVHAKNARANRTISGRINNGRGKAKRHNQEWSITRDEYAKIIAGPCAYCGGPLNPTGSGLDRKDCSIGYTTDNVVPCCGPCNRVKGAILTYDEMKAAMAAVLEVRRKGALRVIVS